MEIIIYQILSFKNILLIFKIMKMSLIQQSVDSYYLISQMTYRPVIHDCKIDCTNPTAVMKTLMTKSDQLYLFWQNYNNLYDAYNTLLLEVERMRTTRTETKDTHVPGFEQYIKTLQDSYKREMDRLKSDKEEREEIIRLRDKQINKLNGENDALRAKLNAQSREFSERVPQTQFPDPRIVEERLKEQFKRILKDLEWRYIKNMRQQLEAAKSETRNQIISIIASTAQQCVHKLVMTTTVEIQQ